MPDVTEKISFRNMQPADIAAGLRLCRDSRWNQVERDWEQFLRLSPEGCRVAIKGEQVVGTVTTVSYQDCFSWIGMVLVDPSERRQGIGTQLLHEALEILGRQKSVGLDATPAGREVYLKLGFMDGSGLSRMETVIANDFAQDKKKRARRLEISDWPQVLKLDREAFGADRRLMLEWLFAGASEYALVLPRDERIAGFIFGRHGFKYEHLGPIVAEDAEAARLLVTAAVSDQQGKTVIIDAAHHNSEWMVWLKSTGFHQQRPFIRMFRGEIHQPTAPEKQFAILGPEFG